ncbi:hypothetical protein JMJ77_0012997, partial [Colletotrichum scovillei]
ASGNRVCAKGAGLRKVQVGALEYTGQRIPLANGLAPGDIRNDERLTAMEARRYSYSKDERDGRTL